MKHRIRRLCDDNDTGYVSTFRSFCVTVLQEDISDKLKTIYEERSLTMRHMTFAKTRDMIAKIEAENGRK